MYHMKHFAILLLLLALGCTSSPSELVTFEHPLFSIEYPNNWVNLEQEGMVLAIAKSKELNPLTMDENPSVIIASSDSLNFTQVGVMNFQQFLEEFRERQLNLENRSLEQDITPVKINGQDLFVVRYKVEGEYRTLLQSQYFFSNSGFYVTVMGTHNFETSGEEVNTIINSLQISQFESLDKLFEIDSI